MISINIVVTIYTSSSIAQHIFPHFWGIRNYFGLCQYEGVWLASCNTGCPRMFYTQKCKILRIFITIKTIELGILVYLGDRTVLLAFWRILNEGNRPNKTENT